MQIILLCGGPGRRLWPVSNGTRAKQYLKLLPGPQGRLESMVQRMIGQLRRLLPEATVTAVAPAPQLDALRAQLGDGVPIVIESERRGTCPAIALAVASLAEQGRLDPGEAIVAMPCDTYTDEGYFHAVELMARTVARGDAPLAMMGVPALAPSPRYGYILTQGGDKLGDALAVTRFAEKPSAADAAALIEAGAMWNAGVYAFLPSLLTPVSALLTAPGSFDRNVAERTSGILCVPYAGQWQDIGTWEALSRLLPQQVIGNTHVQDCRDCTVINELNIPLLLHGTRSLIVAASPDGILVADKAVSASIKEEVDRLAARPMYEERRWGVYKVVDTAEFPDGFSALTKQLTLNPGCSISYQRHAYRDEVWTFIDGSGIIVLDGERRHVGRGYVVRIPRGQMHALRALTPLTFIEVQTGSHLVEEDIERFPLDWEE